MNEMVGMEKSSILMKRPKWLVVALVIVVLFVLCVTGQVVTIVRTGAANQEDSFPASGLDFNAGAYVQRIWPTEVVPAAINNSVPLTTLLAGLTTNQAETLKKYGHQVNNADNILVSFTGVVQGDDMSSPMGTMTVNVTDGQKIIPVSVSIGPVILGTSLRDALNFITFEEFLNQIQYGNVADQLNKSVISHVIAGVDVQKLKGKTVTVYGAYTFNSDDPEGITVTPVILKTGTSP